MEANDDSRLLKSGTRRSALKANPVAWLERGVRICERNNSADTKVSEEGGEGGAPGTGAEIPLQSVVKTMVKQVVPLQPMEVNGGADIYLQPMEDPTPEQVDAPERGCDPMEVLKQLQGNIEDETMASSGQIDLMERLKELNLENSDFHGVKLKPKVSMCSYGSWEGSVSSPAGECSPVPIGSFPRREFMNGSRESTGYLEELERERAALQPLLSQSILVSGTTLSQVKNLVFVSVKIYATDDCPMLQSIQIPLQGLLSLERVNSTSQFGIISKLANDAFNSCIQIIDKYVEQNWP
ncbi:adenomatous polyposis coli protein-like [Grus japonensis]|uniref:Adenomatous polyposis coli protein-like n=1 Tax=Grus japonensis TaxID=30415 RepID=A0ABC9YCP2_GRUJA